jgi:hypothetical protein
VLGALLITLGGGTLVAADRVELAESPAEPRTFRVEIKVNVAGQMQTTTADGKAVALKLGVDAQTAYRERRLPGLGRDALAFRGFRKYDRATAKIQIAEQTTIPELRDALKFVVAEGQQDGLRLFSLAGPLTYSEVDLLRTPADSLTALALLPPDAVELGDTWVTPEWALQFLTGVEAVEKAKMTCEVESLTSAQARIKFQGEITGGILGAAAELKVSGHYLFDLQDKYLQHLELAQTEKRSVSAVSPGLDVSAKVIVERRPVSAAEGLKDEELKGIPFEPTAAHLSLMFDSADWKTQLSHNRNWHLFYAGPQVAVLRMLDKGSLIAQCNLSPILEARPGEHVSEQQFQADVQRALGADFRKILKAEAIPTGDKRFLYRVVATGESKTNNAQGELQPTPMQWMYYLVASPTGQQVVLVFTIEAALLERFQSQDLEFGRGPQNAARDLALELDSRLCRRE